MNTTTFINTGEVNLHNMHYWPANNLHWIRRQSKDWCGILVDRIINPQIFEDHLNGEIYLNFFRRTVRRMSEIILIMSIQIDGLKKETCFHGSLDPQILES